MTSSTNPTLKPYRVVAVTATGHGTSLGYRTHTFATLEAAIKRMEALAASDTLSPWVAQLRVELRDYSTVAYLDIPAKAVETA